MHIYVVTRTTHRTEKKKQYILYISVIVTSMDANNNRLDASNKSELKNIIGVVNNTNHIPLMYL
jgi:hypothetical protein